jgi:trimeric autotransporter adhesin
MDSHFYKTYSYRLWMILILVVLLNPFSFSQLTGVKTIPGDYATIALAIADLNTSGIGTGGVTFNVAAGYTETFSSPTAGLITASGTAADPVIFQKSGSGLNPVITAGVGTSTSVDGIIVIAGGDYITFNGLDVQENPLNLDNTTRMEWGYALVKGSNAAPFNGCQYVIIKNANITLNKANTATVGIYAGNHISTATTSLVITDPMDAMNNCKFSGNIISNVYIGIRLAGYAATTPFALYDQNNEVGVESGNTITNYAGAATTSYGIYAIYQNNIKIANNTINGGTGHTTTFYGIFTSTGTNSNVDIYGNTVTLTPSVTSSTVYGINNGMGASGTSNTVNIYNNILENCSFPAATSAAFYGIYQNSSPFNTNIYGNIVRNNTKQGTGASYLLYNSGGGANGFENMYNNSVYNNSNTAAATMYCLYSNPVSTTTKNVYGNQVYSNSSLSTLYGLYNSTGLVANIHKNNIYDLTTNGAASAVYGIYQVTSAAYFYNNFVSDIKAPSSTSTTAVNGIYISSGNTNLYYNTVFLNAVSTSTTTFGSNGIYASTTPTVELKNNIVVNNSVPGITGGLSVAYRRSTATLTTYANTSDNNAFYAGVPSGSNLIYHDGTNGDQTMSAYKLRVLPRDFASVTENPPFLNTTTAPYNLHVSTVIPTQIESGGSPITTPLAITLDFDGEVRNTSNPDIGADEFIGISADFSAPGITFTPLVNTNSTTPRTIIADINDLSGVPVSGTGLPVLYWKINSGTWNSAQGTYVSGDNYSFTFGNGVVLHDTVSYFIAAQDVSNPPNIGVTPSLGAGNFTANPPAAGTPPTNPAVYRIADAALAGDYTVGLAAFNTITGRNITFEKVVTRVQKEITVEDTKVKPEVKKGEDPDNHSASSLPSVNGTKKLVEVEEIAWIPMENGQIFNGPLYVKKSENPTLNFPSDVRGIYATLTAAVEDLNLRGVSGPTRFLLNDAAYSTETLPLVVNIFNSNKPTIVNTVTFKPNTGVVSVISGSSPAGQIFKIFDSYVTIDGSNAATSRNLTIENTSTTSPQVILVGSTGTTPIVNVTIKNTVIINGANTSSALVVSDGTLPGTAGYFNNITIQNNSIQKAYIANYNIAVPASGNGSGLNINNNEMIEAGANSIRLAGIYVQGVDGVSVENNTISNFSNASSETIRGIWFATATKNANASGNTITNLAVTSTSGAPIGITISSSVGAANINVTGNALNTYTSAGSGTTSGIYIFGTTEGAKIEKNIIYNIKNTNTTGWGSNGIWLGSTLTASNILVANNVVYDIASNGYAGVSVGDNGYGIIVVAGGGYKIYYNSVSLNTNQPLATCLPSVINFTSGVSATAGIDLRDNVFANFQTVGTQKYAIYSAVANTAFANINFNNYYTTGPNIGYLGGIIADLTAWRTATNQDFNSISQNPVFVSEINDFRPQHVSPLLNAGVTLSDVTTDILGITRGLPPTLGAYEQGVLVPVSAPANLIAVADTHYATLNWTDLASNETGFKIERKLGDSLSVNSWVLRDSVAANITTYTDTGLTAFTVYTYRIFAYNAYVVSQYSNLAQVQTLVPVELTSLKAMQNGSSVNIFWTTKSETNNRGFELERRLDENAWETIAFINGNGTTTDEKNYSYSDDFKYNSVEGLMSYRLKQLDYNGTYSYSGIVTVELDFTPKEYTMFQNYPNPFNPSTTIKYALPFASNVRIVVYNMLGEVMSEIMNGIQEPGYYDVTWGGSNLSSGIYFYSIEAKSIDGSNSYSSVKKMMMLK